jgi:hypothetical protein
MGNHLLGNKEIPFVVLEKFIQLKDVWMIKLFENFDLFQKLLFFL